MSLRRALLGMLAAGLAASALAQQPLRYILPTNQGMPLLAMAGQQPADGLLKDLGEALAASLGRPLRFVVLPSKRAMLALQRGEADVHCYVQPGWIDGDPLWTQRFISSAEVVAAAPGAPAVQGLQQLVEQPLGTVLGYRYPKVDAVFRDRVYRRDAVDASTNLRRLALGRLRYALTDRLTLQYFRKQHPGSGLREVLELERTELGCAVAHREAGTLDAINRAIDQMRADGVFERIIARYH